MPRILAGLSLLIAFLCAGPAPAQAPADLTIAVNAPGSANWMVYIAQQAGFFKAEGLNVDVVVTGTPTTTINAVATNSAAFGFDGTDVEIEAIAHALPLRIVAPVFIPIPYVLLTTPAIRSFDDLKGKNVILGSAGDVSSLAFDLLAAQHHLSRNDFTVVHGQTSSARYQALMSGNVQATILSQPFSILAGDNGMKTLLTARDTIPEWLDTSLVVNTNFLAANRPVAIRFVRAFLEGVRYGYAHRDESIGALVAATHISPDTARKSYDLDFTRWHAFDPNLRVPIAGLQAMMRVVVQAGAIPQAPAVGDVYDPSLVADASRRR